MSVGLESNRSEFEQMQTQMEESFAQRGVDPSSGILASLSSQNAIEAAKADAQVRRDAPRQVIQDQTGFLQIGLGQDPSGGVSTALRNQASTDAANAAAAAQASGAATGAAVEATTTALVDYYGNQPSATVAPTPTNVQHTGPR